MPSICVLCAEILEHPNHSIYDPGFNHGFIEQKENTMATIIDPLAGIPTATAKTARRIYSPTKPRTAKAVSTGNVIDLSAAKKRKLTGQEYKDARDFARKTTGYNDTSPIWGQRMPVVLTDIERLLQKAKDQIDNGSYGDGLAFLDDALLLNKELQKRIATGQLIGAQS